MTTEFALDLRAARRKAGYVQGDVAHLLGMHQSTVSELETGRKLPTLTQTVTLSLIYGRSFESLFAAVMKEARRDLKRRLRNLPKTVRDHPGTFNRKASIARLAQSLKEESNGHGSV